MQGRITLITPPDVFENESRSILFIHLDDHDQELVSQWFAGSDVNENLNIYIYDHEIDLPWLFHALGRCDHVFINLDELNNVTQMLSGYLLGKKKVHYKTSDESAAAICQYINQNRITNIEKFLERVFDVENRKQA